MYGFYVDTSRCIGCNACAMACKDWADVQPGEGVQLRRVTTIEAGKVPDVSLVNLSLACMHCGKPACVAVCPAGAITKRAEDGIVVVDSDKCIGCHYCFFACPFGVPQYGNEGTMEKCDLCLERLQAGEKPVCVAACPAGALHAGTPEELSKFAQEKAARRLAGATQPSVLISR
jgi:anaerobic dimethyl sulfoxide reductase subunit B (iron-sulfur subunit)